MRVHDRMRIHSDMHACVQSHLCTRTQTPSAHTTTHAQIVRNFECLRSEMPRCSSSNINEIENNLNTALGRIYDWCVRNKLTKNANKTKSMLIGSKQKVCNTDLNVIIAGSSVVRVNYDKCLGVIIDGKFKLGPTC